MYTVTIKVEAKGEGNDFEQNVTVENLHVKSVEGVNFIQRQLADAMFGIAEAAAKVGKVKK
jgi:hypothetical protein